MNLLTTSTLSQAADETQPGMDFLEFLGEGIVVEDEYLDPVNYADLDQDEVENFTAQWSDPEESDQGNEKFEGEQR